MRQDLIEQEVLHEIAMSIGESIELEAMLSECIPIFLRGLGCATAAVLLKDESDDFYTPNYILPRAAARNQLLHQAIQRTLAYLQANQPIPSPLCHFEGGLYYYAWPIKDFGALLLGRSAPLRDGLYRELFPITNKLALALTSCLQFERLKQAQNALIHARDEAQSANKAKSHFLATMSHEIRTPLNAVINLSELLLDTSLDGRQRQLTQGIFEGGRALLQLVNDVLDFSRIEAGKLEIVHTVFSLKDLLNGLISLFEKEAITKGLHLGLTVAPNVPDIVTTDPSRLRQVLQNLLANAIKFTEVGSVSIHVTTKETLSGTEIIFHVCDTGIGIDEEDKNRLFQEFSQIDRDLDRRFGGSGLGLAIANRLVTMMGGRIGCQSMPGVGSTFWFSLPISSQLMQEHIQPLAKPEHLDVNILLVEDSQTNQMVATAMLEKLGSHITIANHGQEAVDLIQTHEFDLVLMDVSMPGMDGLQATRIIRSMGGKYATIPIIAMTAHAFAHDRDACFEAGMDDYLSKPLQRPQLFSVLAKWANQAANDSVQNTQNQQQIAEEILDLSAKPLLSEDILSALTKETSPSLVKQLISIFLRESREHLECLPALVKDKKYIDAAKHAHAVKSSAGSIGLIALQDVCAQLEIACRESRNNLDGLVQATLNVAEASWKTLEAKQD